MNKITDTSGNYITFHYQRETVNGDYVISKIAYAGNATTGISPNAEVLFEYGSRPDTAPAYLGGSRIRQSLRLSAIKTKVGSAEVRAYTLGYDTSPSSRASRLTTVTECAGSACLPQMRFTYPTTTNANFVTTTWLGHDRGAHNSFTGDFNGDGRADVLAYISGNQWRMCLSGLGGFSCSNWTGHDQGVYRNVVGDFNGDGKADIAGWNPVNSSHQWTVCLSTGTGFNCKPWTGGRPPE